MRIFIQMSIGGFKIFDINQFLHKSEGFCYAMMSEIASTHHGEQNFRTHIILNDSHGMRLELMRLFSSNSISLQLQDDVCDGKGVRCLYVADIGESKDEINRSCDVSFCIMGEDLEEYELIDYMAYLLVFKNSNEIRSKISGLLHTKVLDDELVLAFETSAWDDMCKNIKQQYASPKESFANLVDGKQLTVLNGNLDIAKVYEKHKGLFNDKLYMVIKSSDIPLEKKLAYASDSSEWIKYHSMYMGKDTVCDLFNEIINKFKNIKL